MVFSFFALMQNGHTMVNDQCLICEQDANYRRSLARDQQRDEREREEQAGVEEVEEEKEEEEVEATNHYNLRDHRNRWLSTLESKLTVNSCYPALRTGPNAGKTCCN